MLGVFIITNVSLTIFQAFNFSFVMDFNEPSSGRIAT